MKGKKFIYLVLCLLLGAFIFAGCAPEEPVEEPVEEQTEEPTEEKE